jgi:antitoxin YefM
METLSPIDTRIDIDPDLYIIKYMKKSTKHNVISVSEARKTLADIIERVQTPGQRQILSSNGKDVAVILSVEEYESLIETLGVYEDMPDIAESIREAEKDWKEGKTTIWNPNQK